ncbi:MAG TPA: hypothetical protein PKH77_11920 [Anaerolineae bacterium]|nr:hypothetical protein [Anaerolineae bacterium]
MATPRQTLTIGNVLRADIRGFVVASRIPEPEVPTFGTFVRAPIQQGRTDLIGLVYNISLQDDPFLKNLAINLDQADEEIIRDQRENRVIPVEISVAAVGYRDEKTYRYGLPPQPPMVLYRITVCDADEVRAITASPNFMRPLLENRDVPAADLIPAAIRRAAELLPEAAREAFYLQAGRYLAHYLGRDPIQLEQILKQFSNPVTFQA